MNETLLVKIYIKKIPHTRTTADEKVILQALTNNGYNVLAAVEFAFGETFTTYF